MMASRNRTGLQIRFNSESERDIADFFSNLKKSEVHITAIYAFRTYMRQVGFYDRQWLEDCHSTNILKPRDVGNRSHTNRKSDAKNEGLVDEEAFKALDSMFDDENELSN